MESMDLKEENHPLLPASHTEGTNAPDELDKMDPRSTDNDTADGTNGASSNVGISIIDTTSDADAALDSILETSVAEVNLALSHHDASTAAAAAAIADAALHAADIALQAAAVDAVAHLESTASTSPPPAVSPPPPLVQPVPAPLDDTNGTSGSLMTASVLVSGHKRSFQEATDKNLHMNVENAAPTVDASGHRVGRWTLDEKILFLFGLQKYGKGRWKKISTYVPQRSLVQIKSHAQKVLKRIEAGEDVFGRLEENVSRLQTLVAQIHQANGLAPPIVILQPPLAQRPAIVPTPTTATAVATTTATATATAPFAVPTPIKSEEAASTAAASAEATTTASSATANGTTTAPVSTVLTTHHKHRRLVKKKAPDGTEHILAASALCQLAGPESEGNSSNNSMADETPDAAATALGSGGSGSGSGGTPDGDILAGEEVVDALLEF